MKEIKLTQGKVAIIDDEDYDLLSGYKWQATNNRNYTFYAIRSIVIDGKKTAISMHREIMSVTDRNINVDHKDGNGLNNQRSNLRVCTNAQNKWNRGASKNSKSKYKGVGVWDYSTKVKLKSGIKIYTYPIKYSAIICVNKVKIFLGFFKSEIEAAEAYDEAAIKYHGEFANINFPPVKQSLEDLQELDLKNIAETGQSINLYDMPKHQFFKDGSWRDVSPSQSLYDLALMDIPIRKKYALKSL